MPAEQAQPRSSLVVVAEARNKQLRPIALLRLAATKSPCRLRLTLDTSTARVLSS